jgi:hypothetical protein
VNDWDDAALPRVLVECDDDAVSWAMAKTLGRAGYEVATCSGPSPTARCALVDSGRCELQAGADVIVNCLDRSDEHGRELVQRTVDAYPECPLIVDITPLRLHEGALPDEVSVLVSPWSGTTLVQVVDDAARAGLSSDRSS